MAQSGTYTTIAGVTVETATSGALAGDGSSGNKLAVQVDGVTVTVNGSNQLVASGGGGITSPLQIPNCALWLDASQIVGLNDGDPVATWPDLSGNGYDATQATADNQPIYKTNIQNGLAIVRLDPAVNPQYLELSGSGLSLLQNYSGVTVAFASRAGSNSNAALLFLSGGVDGTITRLLLNIDAASGAANVSVSANTTEDASGTTAVLLGLGTDASFRVGLARLGTVTGQGSVDQPAPQYQNALVAAAPATAFPDTPSINAWVGASILAGYAGDIGEVVVYRRVLNSVETRQLLEYLSTKWGTL